ncbi:hypothetical protein BVY01_02110 [bacterium I07]|nr:hypothetical protein BVY01_02110 [bacterium I07]
MKISMSFRFLTIFLLGFILITGCDRSDLPTASEEMLDDSAEFSLQKKSDSGTIIPGIVHWWPGDGNAKDVIGGNDGQLKGGATFAPGQVGEAFSFDDGYVFIPDEVGGWPEATVEAWVKTEGITGAFQAIMVGDNVAPDFVHLQLHYGWENVVYIDGAPHWLCLPHIDPEPLVGEFHHIAMSIQSGNTILYVDGEEVPPTHHPNPNLTSFNSTNKGEITIGGGWCAPMIRRFNGLIDDVRIYKHALSADEIQAIVNAGTKGMKVAILHKPGTRAEKTLVIPFDALADHLGHGDEIIGITN